MPRLLGLCAAVLVGCGAPVPADTAHGPPMRRIERACEEGVVAEVIDAGPYTYVRYTTATDEGAHWLASLHTEPAVGQPAGFVRYGVREQFRSERLGRTFSTLYFGRIGRCDPDEVTP